MISRASPSRGRTLRAFAEAGRGGDIVFGLPSSGVHSNGFSLVRRIVARAGLGWTRPRHSSRRAVSRGAAGATRIYVKPLLAALKATDKIAALAHITGGGLSR